MKLELLDDLSEAERRALENAIAHVRDVPAGEDLVAIGSRPTDSTLLLEGFAGRYKLTLAGKRQITAVHVPGDFVDLHSFLLKTMDHAVLALTACRIAGVPHTTLRKLTEEYPHLTRLLWLSTLIDGAAHREWLVVMGGLSAIGHAAHLICEFFLRLQTVGLTDGASFALPLTQAEFADCLGISAVHANRILQELRSSGMIDWQDDQVTIKDWDRLAAVGEFDATYLHMRKEPR